MKQYTQISSVALAFAGLGGIGLALRQCLYAFGTDEKGLLIAAHPLEIILWVLTAAAAVLILVTAFKAEKATGCSAGFPAALGCFAFAVGIGVTALVSPGNGSALSAAARLTALPAIPALAYVGLCRNGSKKPFFLAHGLVCLHLTLYTTCHYQVWSSYPQLQDSFFPMIGCIGLMLFSYYQTASDVDMGKRRMQLSTGLLTIFTCVTAISGSAALLYFTGALWTMTNLRAPIQEETV